MSRRNKILIIIFTVVLVILLIIIGILWLISSRQPEEPTNTNQGIQLPGTLPSSSSGTPPELTMPVEEQNLEAGIKAVAATFAERFGSYSNQGNFDNLTSVRDLMTLKMRTATDAFITSQTSAVSQNDPYYGITTKALNVNIINIDEDLGRAEVLVTTQRIETKISTNNPRSFYQDLSLNLNQEGDRWKVDTATWVEN